MRPVKPVKKQLERTPSKDDSTITKKKDSKPSAGGVDDEEDVIERPRSH